MLLPTLISRLFGPEVMLLVIFIIGGIYSGLHNFSLLSFFLTFLIAVIMPPVILVIFALKKKWITDWDISVRKQRVKAFIIFSVLIIFDSMIIRLFNNTSLTNLFTLFIYWFIGYFGITLFWKLSGHTGVATLAIGLVMRWYGIEFWPLIMIIPFIAWSRIALRRHTIAQAVGGVVYSIIFLYEFRTGF